MKYETLFEKYTDETLIKSYEKLYGVEYPDVFDINGLPFHFSLNAKKIGITFSGGADSTLLLYFLCSIIKKHNLETKIYPIYAIRGWKTKPWLEHIVVDVYNFIDKLFPNILKEINYTFLPNEFELVKISQLNLSELDKIYDSKNTKCDVLFVNQYVDYMIEKNNLDFVYSGTTTNPPFTLSYLKDINAPLFRNKKNDTLSRVLINRKINPFALIYKNWIIAQYENFNLNNLLSVTRSCQVTTNEISEPWTIGEKYPEECGNCFFCIEKNWAFDNINEHLLEDQNEAAMLLRYRRH